MKSAAFMMTAGVVAIIGGLIALVNPAAAGVATTTLVGWALLIAAGLQGWAAYNSASNSERLRPGGIAVAAALLGLLMLMGPFGEGNLMRWLAGLLLIASGGAKVYAAQAMAGAQNQVLVYGTAAVSALMGLVVLFGLNLDFGTLVGIELLASGLTLVLLGMHRDASHAQ